MNLILLGHDFPIAKLKADQASRIKYFEALEAIKVDSDKNAFYKLVIRSLRHSIKEHIELAG